MSGIHICSRHPLCRENLATVDSVQLSFQRLYYIAHSPGQNESAPLTKLYGGRRKPFCEHGNRGIVNLNSQPLVNAAMGGAGGGE
jgi:hypothetical protein